MEVILKQDVPNLGYTNETVKVKNGYARNYLIPQGLAIPATESNRKIVAEVMKQKAHKAAKIFKDAASFAAQLETVTVRIAAKAATNGKIFGSVNSIQIAEAIKSQFGYEVDRKKIIIDGDSVKELGDYSATINLHKEVKAVIKFEVYAE